MITMIDNYDSFLAMLDELPGQPVGAVTYALGAMITKVSPDTIRVVVAVPAALSVVSKQEQRMAVSAAKAGLFGVITGMLRSTMGLIVVSPITTPDRVEPAHPWDRTTIYPSTSPLFPGPRSPFMGPTYMGDPPPGARTWWQNQPQCSAKDLLALDAQFPGVCGTSSGPQTDTPSPARDPNPLPTLDRAFFHKWGLDNDALDSEEAFAKTFHSRLDNDEFGALVDRLVILLNLGDDGDVRRYLYTIAKGL